MTIGVENSQYGQCYSTKHSNLAGALLCNDGSCDLLELQPWAIWNTYLPSFNPYHTCIRNSRIQYICSKFTKLSIINGKIKFSKIYMQQNEEQICILWLSTAENIQYFLVKCYLSNTICEHFIQIKLFKSINRNVQV